MLLTVDCKYVNVKEETVTNENEKKNLCCLFFKNKIKELDLLSLQRACCRSRSGRPHGTQKYTKLDLDDSYEIR